MDPWFVPRYYIRDLWHSRSPLSSTTLVHNAFFSSACPRETVQKFEPYLAEYESMLWPLGMMLPFVNVKNVVGNILGWKSDRAKLLVVAGEQDALMGVSLMRQMADVYRKMVSKLFGPKFAQEKGSEVLDNVEFKIVSASGHHLQNDINFEEGIETIREFLDQL